MKYDNRNLLDIAIEIIKEYSKGGGSSPSSMLTSVYKELKELNQELSE